ncbi:MAG: Hpt domain-containing protein [Methylotenera sp.]|nr:Hpt domain-containing protein [Oligoflexia bacterium]
MSTSLDLEVIKGLRELEADSDTGFVAQILNLFLSSVSERVARMETAVVRRDREGVKAEAHSLKSSSGNIGALALSALCQTLEDYGKSSSDVDPVKVMDEFSSELKNVITAIYQLPEMNQEN